jgi:hypothetical protein
MDLGRDVEDMKTLPLIVSDVPQWKYNLKNQMPQRGGKRKQPPSEDRDCF